MTPEPPKTLHTAGDLVERVARAMAVADGFNPDDPGYVRYPGGVPFGKCWHKYINAAQAAIDATAVLDLLEALKEAAATFRFYESVHSTKGTPDGDKKAESNRVLAERYEAVVTKALSPVGGG